MRFRFVILLLLIGFATSTSAFMLFRISSGEPYHWQLDMPHAGVSTNAVNPVTKSVRYFLPMETFSATNATAELNALHACFDVWESVPGSVMQFEFGGLVAPDIDVNTSDGTNVVYWAKNSLFVANSTAHLGGSLAFAFPSTVSGTAVLKGGDIVLNGVEFAWFTDHQDTENMNGFFIEGPVLHEIGHILGMLHTPVTGATMFSRSRRWLHTLQPGLSEDDVAALRHVYPDPATLAPHGTLTGTITKNGNPVYGAAVIAEDEHGNTIGGVLSAANGGYEIVQLAPGTYTVHAIPLDPNNGSPSLVKAIDISFSFSSADVNFTATAVSSVTITAGETTSANIAVTPGTVGIHAGLTRGANQPTEHAAPMSLPQGFSGGSVGLVIPQDTASLDTNATLLVTGTGITFGSPNLRTSPSAPPHPLLTAPVTVAPDAVPGLRSVIIRQFGNPALDVYAIGALEIKRPVIDDNYDGLDDDFQRRWFPLWTAPEAGPDADPDNDLASNSEEAFAGTNPTSATSRLDVQSVTQDMNGTTVTWQSIPSRRYQAYGRDRFGDGNWAAVGSPVTAIGSTASAFDAGATGTMKFYRVEVLAKD